MRKVSTEKNEIFVHTYTKALNSYAMFLLVIWVSLGIYKDCGFTKIKHFRAVK